MLFDKKDNVPNERVIYNGRPNMLFGCKKAIFGAVLLAIVLMVSPWAIKFIGKMQVYLISQINLPLTRYAAIIFFVLILVIVVYIIFQLIGWYSKEYTLTDTRVTVKSGILSTKKNYMPYAAIQDIDCSQNIIEKVCGIGSISLFSAYDNNQIVLKDISNPSEVEEIIFNNMVNSKSFNEPPNRVPRMDPSYERNFQNDDYYDEFEPITPIRQERDNIPRRDYEYYPDEFGYSQKPSRNNRYEYEPYDENYYKGPRENKSIRYEGATSSYSNDGYHERPRQEYYPRDDGYNERPRQEYYPRDEGYSERPKQEYYPRDDRHYQNDGRDFYQNDNVENVAPDQGEDVDELDQSAIRRHFDKFKK